MSRGAYKRVRRYRLYVDESGDHTYGKLDDIGKRYLGLTGCFVEQEYYRTKLHPAMASLKQKHFPHNPDEPVVLHRKEIVNAAGPFWRLRDDDAREAFNADLLAFLSGMDYVIITVVIDKKAHTERYGAAAFHPYNYCLAVMLERYCGFLNHFNAKGDVLAESRGGKEDRLLKASYRDLLERGTQWRDESFFRNALTSKELKVKPKVANIAGLQLADILAYPSKNDVLVKEGRGKPAEDTFGSKVSRSIQGKYNRHLYQGRIGGYGKVFLK